MHRIGFVLAIAVATVLTAAAATARAAMPTQEWRTIDETFAWNDCGFQVVEHDVARLRFISWYDAAGNRTRQIVVAPGSRVTYTNPLTGASVTTVNPYAVHKTDNPDGSVVIAFTGLVFALHGGGKAYVEAGRALVLFAPDGARLLAKSGPSADLCEALRATIG